MSIALQNRVDELERRVAAMEQAFQAINDRTQRNFEDELARMQAGPPQIQKTLTLSKKQPNA